MRPPLRAGGPPGGRRLWALDPGDDERRRGAQAGARPRLRGHEIRVALGTATDPYQERATAPARSRLEAIRHLSAAGIDVGVGMAPILPRLSDGPEQLEAVVRAAREAGARIIWASVVHLRPGVREHFLEALARDWPDEVARYEQLFANRAYLPTTIARPLQEHVRAAARATPLRRRVVTRTGRQARAPEQLKLAVSEGTARSTP